MNFVLPYPPSANVYWRNWHGRMVVSNEARAYKKTAALKAKADGVKKLKGHVCLMFWFYRPRKSGDLSNRIKVLEDALEGVAYENDEQIVRIDAQRMLSRKNSRVEVLAFAPECKGSACRYCVDEVSDGRVDDVSRKHDLRRAEDGLV